MHPDAQCSPTIGAGGDTVVVASAALLRSGIEPLTCALPQTRPPRPQTGLASEQELRRRQKKAIQETVRNPLRELPLDTARNRPRSSRRASKNGKRECGLFGPERDADPPRPRQPRLEEPLRQAPLPSRPTAAVAVYEDDSEDDDDDSMPPLDLHGSRQLLCRLTPVARQFGPGASAFRARALVGRPGVAACEVDAPRRQRAAPRRVGAAIPWRRSAEAQAIVTRAALVRAPISQPGAIRSSSMSMGRSRSPGTALVPSRRVWRSSVCPRVWRGRSTERSASPLSARMSVATGGRGAAAFPEEALPRAESARRDRSQALWPTVALRPRPRSTTPSEGRPSSKGRPVSHTRPSPSVSAVHVAGILRRSSPVSVYRCRPEFVSGACSSLAPVRPCSPLPPPTWRRLGPRSQSFGSQLRLAPPVGCRVRPRSAETGNDFGGCDYSVYPYGGLRVASSLAVVAPARSHSHGSSSKAVSACTRGGHVSAAERRRRGSGGSRCASGSMALDDRRACLAGSDPSEAAAYARSRSPTPSRPRASHGRRREGSAPSLNNVGASTVFF